MNVQHRTLNIERRIMYSAIINKGKAKRLQYSTLSVGRSMFDVQFVASEINHFIFQGIETRQSTPGLHKCH